MEQTYSTASGPNVMTSDMTRAAEVIATTLAELELEHQRLADDHFVAELPGTRRLKTTCHLKLSPHSLQISAFVMRHPDEAFEDLWAYLLTKNARSYTVSWAIDKVGDVYLMGRLPLIAVTAEEVDRVLGTVLQQADDNFNPMLEIGFRTAIAREWKWRISRGEPTNNLAAFRNLIESMEKAEKQPDLDAES
ncbi:YbjN domain-containing protein [Cumulibacter soli]|uniref:YbjN domain-containing protein n=1 Tax=Cumulibacter soli TaxID=2546344 RepID=UPI001FBAFD33|nr:YbjN domain-containing protein [Cumulibacter soli]